jgi:Asp-tRNA(Asn)/Glu-tRNA(Gln) amidotransferase A subunit family amidase
LAAAANGERVLPDLSPAGTPRIALCHTHEWPHADDDTRVAFVRAEQVLADSGLLAPALQLPAVFSELLQAQKEIMAFDLVRSLAHERLQHAAQLSAGLTQLLQEQGMPVTIASHRANLQRAAAARAQIDTVFRDLDALLVPSAIGEAPTLEQTGDPVFGRVWTLLGLPCVHLPFTTGHSGLPVGLQLVGRHGQDRALLRIAKDLLPRLCSGDGRG